MKPEPRLYADFSIRLLAIIIDTFVFLPVSYIVGALIPGLFYQALVSLIITGTIYTLFLSGPWQATPGKRLVGIYVMHQSGRALTNKEALERFLAYIMPSLPLYSSVQGGIMNVAMIWLLLIWFLPVITTRQRTGVHDLLCNTRVVLGKPQGENTHD